MADSNFEEWFPRTKLFPPRLREDVLERPLLFNSIYEAVVANRLTIISAPAGSGKTTSAAAVVHAHQETTAVWIKFDADDNHPISFIKLLLGALEQIIQNLTKTTQTWLDNPQQIQTGLKQVIGVLINELVNCRFESIVLVFDDFHLITDETIIQAVDYLLENAPPELHLLINTRHALPLALPRLRARGQLAEFSLVDLRFSGSETDLLLNHKLHLDLSLSETNVLQQQTEGWVAALRMLGNSLSSTTSSQRRAELIKRLPKTSRYIFDLLAEEVLNQQTETLQNFLLETSILVDLEPEVCAAVTGQSNAANLLEDIYKRNLFLITAVGEEHGLEYSYRYHTLFAEFLQHQLSHRYPQRKVQLHRLAAEFLQAPTQRVHHYMAAEVWDEAAGLIEMVGRNQLEQNYVSNELFQWISELPDPLIERRPWLVLLQGVFKKQTGYMQAADGLLNRAFTVFAAANDTEGQLYALIHINGLEGVPIPPEKTKQAEQMLDAHPDLVSPIIQAHFHLSIAWRSLYQNDWISAEEHLYNAVYITEKSNDFGAYQLMSLSIGPQFLFADRGIPPIKAFFQHVLNRFGEGDSPLHMGAYANYGCIHFFQGKLDLARQAAAHAQDINRSLGSFAYMDMPINQVLLYDMLARADYKTLDAYLESLLPQLMESDTAQAMLPGFLYVQGRSFLLQDKLDDCRAVHERISDVFQYYTEQKVDERALILGGLIAAQAGDFSEAEALLQDAIEIQRFTRHTVLSSDARLSLAQLYITWDKPERASNLLQITLKDLEQRGMPGVLLQEGNAAKPLLRYAVKQHIQEAFAARVLKIFDKSSKPSSLQIEHHDHGDFEPLSDREIEVIRLLADGMTNPQIASRLFISTGTVKRHTVNIYRKLRVHNRTQAVNRARSLNLI